MIKKSNNDATKGGVQRSVSSPRNVQIIDWFVEAKKI